MRVWQLVMGFIVMVTALDAFAEQTDRWAVVCPDGDPAAASSCYLSFEAGDRASESWLGIAVHHVEGVPEVQVTSNGHAYSRAEINARSDTTVVTDYCYGTYCVFVQADELVEQFRKGARARVWLYNGGDHAPVNESVSLMGFSRAYESYLARVGG